MQERAIPIGEYLYLFRPVKNKVSWSCVIAAHGGYHKNMSTFRVPKGVTVYFYIPEKSRFSFTGVDDFLSIGNLLHVVEKFGEAKGCKSKDCPDYILEKIYNSKPGQEKHNPTGLSYDALRDEMDYARTPMNVLAVRNRAKMPGKADVCLKFAIEETVRADPLITEFHCAFCRVLIGKDGAKLYAPEKEEDYVRHNKKMTRLDQ